MKVTLLTSHTHAGTEYQAGATITVAAVTAAYLEQHGIGTSKSPIRRQSAKKERKP